MWYWILIPLAPVAAVVVVGLAALARRPVNNPDWADAELIEIIHPADPLTRPVAEVELATATIFDEVAAAHAIQVDWAPPSWSQEWRIAGERLRELGDTQTMPAIGADASTLVGSL